MAIRFHGTYERKAEGGLAYEYMVSCSLGQPTIWDARVYRNGEFKGAPRGIIADGDLDEAEVQLTIQIDIESIIENLHHIEE